LTLSAKIAAEVQPVRFTPLDERVLSCSFGHYPWDDWERRALDAGVAKELAGLGRAVMREAYQHDWTDELKSLCGWRDDGQALLTFALRAPKTARRQWDILMRTDGLRGDYRARSTEWVYGFLRADAQRLAARLYKRAIVQHLSAFSADAASQPSTLNTQPHHGPHPL
jgi:hypothetical protein